MSARSAPVSFARSFARAGTAGVPAMAGPTVAGTAAECAQNASSSAYHPEIRNTGGMIG
jgi:hypothetical protein